MISPSGPPTASSANSPGWRSSWNRQVGAKWNDLLYDAEGFFIERFDLETRRARKLTELGSDTRIGKYGALSASPDGRWLLYPRDDGLGSDLMMVDGFFESSP